MRGVDRTALRTRFHEKNGTPIQLCYLGIWNHCNADASPDGLCCRRHTRDEERVISQLSARLRRTLVNDLVNVAERRIRSIGGPVDWSHARAGTAAFQKAAIPPFCDIAEIYQDGMSLFLQDEKSGVGKTTALAALLNSFPKRFERQLSTLSAWQLNQLCRRHSCPYEDPTLVACLHGSEDPEPPATYLDVLRSPLWVDGWAVARARREAPLGEGEPERIRAMKQASLLAIDEVGLAWDRDQTLFEVIDYRYRKGKPTLVTCGQSTDEFQDRFGAQVYRRLTEPGIGLHVSGSDGDAP